jgi:hypothetical protein
MVTFLITSVVLIGLFAIALYFWQKPTRNTQTAQLPPPTQMRGLFDSRDSSNLGQLAPVSSGNEKLVRETLIERAWQADSNALQEALELNEREVYDEVLNALVDQAKSAPQLLSLLSHITRHELPVNQKLAVSLIESWKEFPDRNSTTRMLHVAALSDDAETYKTAVEVALKAWRDNRLTDVSPHELQALFSGEFWVLSSRTRSSGAGFVLKRTLASARNELDATN